MDRSGKGFKTGQATVGWRGRPTCYGVLGSDIGDLWEVLGRVGTVAVGLSHDMTGAGVEQEVMRSLWLRVGGGHAWGGDWASHGGS